MGKSSKDKRDIYYRKAKEEGYRARSAFKLLQIQEEFNIFAEVERVVDLCAAPGSWSQVLSKYIYEPQKDNPAIKIVSVDLQDISPIDGVIRIQGDITEISTAEKIISHFEGKYADLVVCDGAPDVTGLHDLDQYIQSQLILAALNITTHILRRGGTFVAKIFRGKDISLMYSQLKIFFPFVTIVKPKSSRNSSLEAFVLCQNYSPPKDYLPTMIKPNFNLKYDEKIPVCGPNSIIVPFLACGDLSGFDADQTYHVDEAYVPLEPVQKPIDPPYQHAVELKRSNKLDSKIKSKVEDEEKVSKKQKHQKENNKMNTSNEIEIFPLKDQSDSGLPFQEPQKIEEQSMIHEKIKQETEKQEPKMEKFEENNNNIGMLTGVATVAAAVFLTSFYFLRSKK